MRPVVGFVALFALLGVAVADPPPNLLANGTFDETTRGWSPGGDVKGTTFDWANDGGRGKSGALHVRVESGVQGGPWIWWGFVEKPPTDSALKISGWIRGKDVEKIAAICVQAWAGDDRRAGFATTATDKQLRGDFEWTHVETILPATPRMDRLAVLAFTVGSGQAWFDDLRVERTDEKPAASKAPPRPAAPKPGLVLVRGESYLIPVEDGAAPRVLFPVPLSYREQVPLTYELTTDPPGAVAKARIYEDHPGNYVLDARFAPIQIGKRPRVHWTSLVLVGERSFVDVPERAAIPVTWPGEARPWLKSTYCVQCEDDRIVAAAKPLHEGTDDVLEIIRRVERRASRVFREASGRVDELTAVEALDKQGSCTSCANLVAGLLRASGVPARVLSGYPLWSGPLQTHYVVEAYVPEYGWYPIESTMCRSPWQPYQQIEVSIVPPKYEDRSQRRTNAAGGVPFLSLTEVPDEDAADVGALPDRESCDHVATLVRALPTDGAAADWNAAYDVARKRWSAWLASAKLDDKGRLATTLQPDDVKAATAAELAKELAR